jgi:pimeloyl-ACP methyl ester carboxylesterase
VSKVDSARRVGQAGAAPANIAHEPVGRGRAGLPTLARRWELPLARLWAVAALVLLTACSDAPRPDLGRLYRVGHTEADRTPVILIPGVFGSRLRDRASGEEVWPGPWWRLATSSYPELALDFDAATGQPKDSRLEAFGIAEQAFGQDFYRPIIDTLVRHGGYVRSVVGTKPQANERRLYVFAYDWRQDNVRSAQQLHRTIEAIRAAHGDPALKVDLVAHSMGGLVARYYLRFGDADVLDGTPRQVTMDGAARVRKLVLLGTPNLGSVSSLHAFLTGERIGLARIAPRTLATLPSGYQLFPHPLAHWLIGIDGQPVADDLFDAATWQRHRWSVYGAGAANDLVDEAALRRYFVHNLERARRFAWMLSVDEPVSPIRIVLFGGDCHLTPARLLVEGDAVRLAPGDIKVPRAGVPYDELMLEPGDGRVTKPSLLARETLDPSAPQHEDSFLPVAYPFFLCEHHSGLTNNINFQDNLLNVLLSRQLPWESTAPR